MNIQQIKQAVRLADLESVKTVDINMSDLVALINYIESLEKQLDHLSNSLIKCNNQYTALFAQSILNTPPHKKRLDEYV